MARKRYQAEEIIRNAGLEPWPKVFQNLRSTRETELAEQFPMHVVCKWIGNCQPVAAAHYLQFTDEDRHTGRPMTGPAGSLWITHFDVIHASGANAEANNRGIRDT